MKTIEPYTLSAKYYDMIYQSKAKGMYENTLRDIFIFSKEIFGRDPRSVLDIGCGTGNHATILAEKGIRVVGIDLSSEQLEVARSKVNGDNPSFVEMDMSVYQDFGETFEVGAAFFGGFCYLLDDEKVISFLKNCEKWIDENGFLFLEFWNTVGIRDGSKHFFETEEDGIKLLRYNENTIDVKTGIASMLMYHKIIDNGKLVADFCEDHRLKTYTIPYFASLVKHTNWKIHRICSLKDGEIVAPILNDLRYYAILTRE